MTEGYIYILFNRAFQNDQYKIGKTTTTPEARAGNIRGNGPASGSQSSAFGAGANAKKGVPSATGQVSARPQTRVAGFKNYDWFPQMEPANVAARAACVMRIPGGSCGIRSGSHQLLPARAGCLGRFGFAGL